MPLYDYYCKENDKTVSVKHSMAESIATWGELCNLANLELGETAATAKIEKVISGGLAIPRKTTNPVPEKTSCNTGGCGCC